MGLVTLNAGRLDVADILFFAGLKRIESTAGCARINAVQLDASESAAHLTTILMNTQNGLPFDSQSGQFESMESVERRRDDYLSDVSAAKSVLESGIDKSALYYKLRNTFLVLGFITILCAKIAQPYTRGVSAEKTISPEIEKPMQPLSPFTNLSGQTNR